MHIQLFLDGKEADLITDEKIAVNYQVNRISDINTRETDFTYHFSLPRTPANIQIFEGLGLMGDTSTIPYRKMEATLKIDGYTIISKGWLKLAETTKEDYKVAISSGVIDFFKAIQNKNMSDIPDLSEIQHEKNIDTVINSIDNPYYKYPIADYNGLTHYDKDRTKIINIDPIAPSVAVKYLWDKMHKYAGFTYTGSIFDTQDFNNLWLTYSKSVGLQEENVFDSADIFFIGSLYNIPNSPTSYHTFDYARRLGNSGEVKTFKENEVYKPIYRTPSSGTKLSRAIFSHLLFKKKGVYSFDFNSEGGEYLFAGEKITLAVCQSKEDKPLREIYNYDVNRIEYSLPKEGTTVNKITKKFNFEIKEDNTLVYFILKQEGIPNRSPGDIKGLRGTLSIIGYPNANPIYTQDLSQLSMTDFYKEILNRFGLTPLVDVDKKEVKYLTISERVNAEAIDWTDKYINRESETYLFGQYAQENTFKLQYNDKEEDYNNGSIKVDNINLDAEKEAFSSKFYSPEREATENFYLGDTSQSVLLMKFFDKEIKENPKNGEEPIKYKPLQKRFHLIRINEVSTNVSLGSKVFNKNKATNKVAVAHFDGLSWGSLISKYYNDLRKIISRSRLHTINLNLNLIDILSLSFDKLYYFQQEGHYYLLDALRYTTSTKEAKAVFVKVDKTGITAITTPMPELGSEIAWDMDSSDANTWTDQFEDRTGKQNWVAIDVLGTTGVIVGHTFQIRNANTGMEWSDYLDASVPSITYTDLTDGLNEFRLKLTTNRDEVYYSNTLKYTRQSSVSDNPPPTGNLYAEIEWDAYAEDAHTWTDKTGDRVGEQSTVSVYIHGTSGVIQKSVYQIKNANTNNSWADYADANTIGIDYTNLALGDNEFRLKMIGTNGSEGYSNTLKYTRQ
ncbi:hypothetical protein PG614_04005 [Riemerella anatipestifer]|nr:hypothetical protein [Riemerella anatipestifer]MDY3532339.1 hypothetical protein [Riemerella anatipestifer]MDY3535106.1 hypothetical protein [Riemerella anatipestifer]